MDKNNITINFMSHGKECSIPLVEYCKSLSKRNQVVLFKLEDYLGVDLSDNETLVEVRKLILSVSGDIMRLANNMEMNRVED